MTANIRGRSASSLFRMGFVALASPRAAGVLPHHRLARLAGERVAELFHVGDGADHAELAGRVGVGLRELAGRLLGLVLAPDVGEAEEEALLRREAVDGRVRLALQRSLQRAIGDV